MLSAWSLFKKVDLRSSTLHFRASSLRCSMISSAANLSRSVRWAVTESAMGRMSIGLLKSTGWEGAPKGSRNNTSHRGVDPLGPLHQPLTAGTVKYPVMGAISHPSPATGGCGHLKGRPCSVSVGPGCPVAGQQGLGFIIPELARLAQDLACQLQPVAVGDSAIGGGNKAELGGDAAADVKAGHRSRNRRESVWLRCIYIRPSGALANHMIDQRRL